MIFNRLLMKKKIEVFEIFSWDEKLETGIVSLLSRWLTYYILKTDMHSLIRTVKRHV